MTDTLRRTDNINRRRKRRRSSPEVREKHAKIKQHARSITEYDLEKLKEIGMDPNTYGHPDHKDTAGDVVDLEPPQGRPAHSRGRGKYIPFHPAFAFITRRLVLQGATVEEIATYIGVHTSVMYRWMALYPDMQKAMRSTDAMDDRVERALFERAIGGDTAACIFWLKRRRREQWDPPQDAPLIDTDDPTADQPSVREVALAMVNLLTRAQRDAEGRTINITPDRDNEDDDRV